ncbi:hypothetical protein Rhal01_02230 [Rubritalea halochordaticola]|uniref:DUF2589 domain-containing protein n=2 Tax=Rubritalea halochordaticola TaxID=714537 RepID=A0ABP9V032_9BACT
MSQQFSGLPIESLIGAPLQAATQANATMATTQVNFLKAICFNALNQEDFNKELSTDANATAYQIQDSTQVGYTPVMVQMIVSRQMLTGPKDKPTVSVAKSVISLPILTLIPLNSLAVTSADVTFDMEVKSSTSSDTSQKSSSSTDTEGKFSATAKYNAGFFSVSATVSGSVSKKSSTENSSSSHYEASNKAKYTINVKAGQLPLPEGVKTIIDAYSQAISPIDMTTEPAGNKDDKTK